ncbi:hypothetical protein GCM10010483_67880 [Actinokineospora diospyrosa]
MPVARASAKAPFSVADIGAGAAACFAGAAVAGTDNPVTTSAAASNACPAKAAPRTSGPDEDKRELRRMV